MESEKPPSNLWELIDKHFTAFTVIVIDVTYLIVEALTKIFSSKP